MNASITVNSPFGYDFPITVIVLGEKKGRDKGNLMMTSAVCVGLTNVVNHSQWSDGNTNKMEIVTWVRYNGLGNEDVYKRTSEPREPVL